MFVKLSWCYLFFLAVPLTALVIMERANSCSVHQWKCRDGSCISFDGVCDGTLDCPDRTDETHALCRNTMCPQGSFKCTYGACVAGTALCNNLQDCADNSDELHKRCTNTTTKANSKQFTCEDGSVIPVENQCDGAQHCADGSDETVRSCAAQQCLSHLFQCAYGACVDKNADCNGVQECADNSDEAEDLCRNNSAQIRPSDKSQPRNCILPPYPANGIYLTNFPNAKPGDAIDNVTIVVLCQEGYGVAGSNYTNCVKGQWREQMPKCVPVQCHLIPHASIEYRCFDTGFTENSRVCNEYEPNNTVVKPECNHNYYAATPLTNMWCIDGSWSYIARCSPGFTKNGTRITILVKDIVEVHISDFQYVVSNSNNNNLSALPVTIKRELSSNLPGRDEVTNENPGAYVAITVKPINNSSSDTINGASANVTTDTKIDESDYEIDEIDFRQGSPAVVINKNSSSQNSKRPNQNQIDNNNKVMYNAKTEGANIYVNISNNNVHIYTNEN